MKEGAGSTKTIIHRHQQQIKKKAACLAPPVSWVKMNSNVTFCLRTGRASIGVVARDQKGDLILSSWRFLRHCGSPEEAEVEACLEGLRLVVEWIRHYPIYGETDCAGLVEAL
jgi:hypothetical protein